MVNSCATNSFWVILSVLYKYYMLFSHVSLFKCRFEIVGYGCSTCVGNTAPLSEAVLNAVKQVKCGLAYLRAFVLFVIFNEDTLMSA